MLLADTEDASWALVPIRARDRAAAHVRSLTLDAELAAGEPVTADRLRAVRAAMLVAPALRHQLARGWEDVLTHPSRGIIPVLRSEVLAARDEIHELAAALRMAGPVAPRGVAIANLLLTDGTGPLYSPAGGRGPARTGPERHPASAPAGGLPAVSRPTRRSARVARPYSCMSTKRE